MDQHLNLHIIRGRFAETLTPEGERWAPHGFHEPRAERAGDIRGAVAQQLAPAVRLKQRQRILCQAARARTCL